MAPQRSLPSCRDFVPVALLTLLVSTTSRSISHQTLLPAKVTSFFPQLWSANNDLTAPSIARC